MKKLSKKTLVMYTSYVIGFAGLGAFSFMMAKPLLTPKVDAPTQQVVTATNIQKPVEVAPKVETKVETKTETPVAPKVETKIEGKVATSAPVATKNIVQETKTPIASIPQKVNIYDFMNIDKAKVIVDSPKFTVTLDKTNVKVGDGVKFTVTGAKENKVIVTKGEVYGHSASKTNNGDWDGDIYSGITIIQGLKPIDGKIKSYIFIYPEGENMIYEYGFDLTVAP